MCECIIQYMSSDIFVLHTLNIYYRIVECVFTSLLLTAPLLHTGGGQRVFNCPIIPLGVPGRASEKFCPFNLKSINLFPICIPLSVAYNIDLNCIILLSSKMFCFF